MIKSTILRTEINVYGYADEAEFRKTEENGVIRFDLYLKERWEDGHFTYPNYHHRRFKNADEGNKIYMDYLKEGYKLVK